jgi:hypothetical protein
MIGCKTSRPLTVKHHRAISDMETQQAIKQNRAMQVIALSLFLLICGLLALPVLTVGGDVCGTYKLILVLVLFCRLAWQIYKRTFRFRDYFIYFAIAIAFCIWADYELDHEFP